VLNVAPSDLKKNFGVRKNCKLCSNSKKIHHNITFQATSDKRFRQETAGLQVGTKLSWDPWMFPVSKIMATRLSIMYITDCIIRLIFHRMVLIIMYNVFRVLMTRIKLPHLID